MDQTVTIQGKSIRVCISKRAAAQLQNRTAPLLLEMELYFSCLLRKRVNVRDSYSGDDAVAINDKLKIWFRPVVTKTCAIRDCEPGHTPVTDMPIVRPERYIPHWLTLDYKRGEWRADFGYADMLA